MSTLQDRESFARLVREVAAPDVAAMGVEILSFTIRDLADRVQYLDSLGRATVAAAKRDAAVGVSEAHRDASIQVSRNLYNFSLGEKIRGILPQ